MGINLTVDAGVYALRIMRAAIILVALAALPARARAADYPTAPNEMDKLCEVIGGAPNLSVPPKDRLWFKENCICSDDVGCGRAGSAKRPIAIRKHRPRV